MHACVWVLAVIASVVDPVVVTNEIPPDERLYTFESADVTYEELIDCFAQQAGLEVVGEPPTGHIQFQDCGEPISFQLAMSRINILLFLESHHYLRWDPDFGELEIWSLGTQHLPLKNIYPTVDEFLTSDRQPHELVAVLLTPLYAIDDWPGVSRLIPPYLRSGEYAASDNIVFFGTVTDVQRYIPLGQMMGDAPHDSYWLRIFRVEPGVASIIADDLESKLSHVDVYREIKTVSDESLSEGTTDVVNDQTPEVIVWFDDLCGSLVVRYVPTLETSVIRIILEASSLRDNGHPPVPIE